MKQSKKIILSLASILPLAIPVTVISCEYTEKRKLITDKIDELLNTKIDNDIASQTISDAIQRVRENNVGSLVMKFYKTDFKNWKNLLKLQMQLQMQLIMN